MNKIILSAIILFAAVSTFGCMRVSYDIGDDNLNVLQEKTFQISEGKLLKLSTPSGRINISSWDKNEVYIKVTGNDKAKEKIEFNFNNTSEMVEVIAKSKGTFLGMSFGTNVRMNYEIKVPRNFNTEGKTSGGDIYIENLAGNQMLRTSGGNVNARNMRGAFDGSTSGGDIKIDNLAGKIKVSTSGGDINAKEFKGDFIASTSGGNVKLIASDARIKAGTSGGNIYLEYTGENRGIDLSTSGGNIEIKLPKEFSATALLKTSGGNIDSDFRGNNAVKISSTRFEADINKGGNPLHAETSGGNIELKSW